MKKVLITGASKGIGLALAKNMLVNNYQVTGLARAFKADSPLEQKIEVDLANLALLETRLNQDPLLRQDFDIVILNAGYGQFGGLEQFSFEQIQRLINTNLVSNLYLLKHLLPQLNKNGSKDIVLLGSEAALAGAKQGAVYCASKFALRGLAQSLRADTAGNGNRVILVNPGPTDSDFFEPLHFTPKHGDDYALQVDTVAETIMSALRQPRNTVVEEINIQPLKRAFEKR